MTEWMLGTPTRADVIFIALTLAFLFALFAGLGAEHAAKAYADRIAARIRGGE